MVPVVAMVPRRVVSLAREEVAEREAITLARRAHLSRVVAVREEAPQQLVQMVQVERQGRMAAQGVVWVILTLSVQVAGVAAVGFGAVAVAALPLVLPTHLAVVAVVAQAIQ